MPASKLSCSYRPNASSSPSFDPKYRYSVGRETFASEATSDSCNFRRPSRASTTKVAARIRRRVDSSASAGGCEATISPLHLEGSNVTLTLS